MVLSLEVVRTVGNKNETELKEELLFFCFKLCWNETKDNEKKYSIWNSIFLLLLSPYKDFSATYFSTLIDLVSHFRA